ncbi:guanine nucleotide-binding protein subunit beta 1 [Kluyveromyces marxianus]|uniref:Guanine nucleotide-binding protein subunit beta 1 n=1 Tax=Kluyveromyces marxianus TaxID=4911 RepID=A0ABX6EXU6_KLUMA|nr:guanine nucleotide-binding protein subunit beta 1 [Kluyveromyces marxianus]
MDPLSQVPELSDDYPSGNNPANSPPINYEWNEIPNVYKSVNKDGKYTKYELLSYVTVGLDIPQYR